MSVNPARNTNARIHGPRDRRFDEARPVPMVPTKPTTRAATDYGPLIAGLVLATLPTIVLVFVVPHRQPQGIVSGAVRR